LKLLGQFKTTISSENVDMADGSGCTALSLAVRYGFTNIMDLLLKAHASPLIEDVHQKTALDIAFQMAPSYFGSKTVDVIKALVQAGGDVMRRDSHGATALHRAVGNVSYYRQPSYIKILVECGVELDATDEKGETALHYAGASSASSLDFRLSLNSFTFYLLL
jgi:ankyrin repeat protein